jgi:serine/threonine-protein kinase
MSDQPSTGPNLNPQPSPSQSTLPMPPREEAPFHSDTESLPPTPESGQYVESTLHQSSFEVRVAIGDGGLTSLGPGESEIDALPGYRIEGELGRGGMGVVYKAVQTKLNRLVAVKMIAAGAHAGRQELERFNIEAETIARLSHPNIIQIFEVGSHEDKPFISLEFCRDGSLDGHLKKDGPLSPREAAGLVETLARGIQIAHEEKVIHRDLKPANVLLVMHRSSQLLPQSPSTSHPSVCSLRSIPCTPKITDFGLAKNISSSGATQSGAIMGTPSYMAPEQALGKINLIGPGTDVYALGAILYECLTGRPPFQGPSPLETVKLVAEQQPVPPRMLNRNIDPDLEKIVLKCLEKESKQRYPTAEELADDLRRYRFGEPIKARSVNLFERFQRELAYSQHDAMLRPWGNALFMLAALMFCGYLATSVMLHFGISEALAFWIPRLLMIGCGLPLFWMMRPGGVWMPTNAVERLIWAVWIGYFICYTFAVWVLRMQGIQHLDVYAMASILSALSWFAMGGYLWGGCYLFGWIFLGASLCFAKLQMGIWTPFAFGVVWTFVLIAFGIRYRLAGRD